MSATDTPDEKPRRSPAARAAAQLGRASAALATPFDETGAIDWQRQTARAAELLAAGLTSVTLFGTTGEGASVAYSERRDALARFDTAGVAPGHVIMALYGTAPVDVVVAGREALESGCGAVLVPPPFYFPLLGNDGLFSWFANVFEGLGGAARDVILYNIPGVTGVEIPSRLVHRLREAFPVVVAGVKDSSGDFDFTCGLLADHGDLAILVGHEGHLAEGVRRGAAGAISGIANFRPDLVLELSAGREEPRANRLVEAILRHPVVPAVKELTAHLTGEPRWRGVRPPLQALDAAVASALRADYDALFVRTVA